MNYLNNENIISATVEVKDGLVKIIQKKAISDLGGYKGKNKKGIIFQIVKAVCFLNNLNVLHCDIKPVNILLFENSVVKLSDFSLCRFASSKSTKRAYTPNFRPPEEILTNKSDVFALGCTIYEIMFNEPYFSREGIQIHIQRDKESKQLKFMELVGKMIVEEKERIDINKVYNDPYFEDLRTQDRSQKVGGKQESGGEGGEKFKRRTMTLKDHIKNLKKINDNDLFIEKALFLKPENCKNYNNMDLFAILRNFKIYDYYFK